MRTLIIAALALTLSMGSALAQQAPKGNLPPAATPAPIAAAPVATTAPATIKPAGQSATAAEIMANMQAKIAAKVQACAAKGPVFRLNVAGQCRAMSIPQALSAGLITLR